MNTFIKIPEAKNINLDMNINLYLDSKTIFIPIVKKENFKLNSYVYKNTYFGNYISSISGKITGSKKIKINKKIYPALVITNDFKEEAVKKEKRKKIINKEDLLTILKEYHLDNIIAKINHKNIKRLVVTSIDEDPYTFNELLILASYSSKICDTISKLLKILAIDNAIIAVKDTFFRAIKNVKSIIGTYHNINMKLIRDYYSVSYDKVLCKELNIKEDESLVLTSNDIYNLYNILKERFVNEVFMTISGDVIEKSMVVKTRIGTSIKEIVDKLVVINNKNYDIYINGIVKGIKVDDLTDYIVTDEVKSIVFKKREVKELRECINCGVCVKVCPVNIDVIKCLEEHKQDKNCLDCGLCNYICPSNINLKDVINGGK